MQVPIRLSQESLFGFLASTRLPVVSSLSAVIRWLALGLGTAAAVNAGACLLFAADGWWAADLPFSGAVPGLAAAPWCFAAWWVCRQRRFDRAALLLAVGLVVGTSLANWPRGAFSILWYVQPFLALLASISLGVVPGLVLTLLSVLGMLFAALGHAQTPGEAAVREIWVHAASLSALTLASALAGAIVNRLVFMTLLTAETQRRRYTESSRALRHREKLLRHALRVETVGDLAGMVCHQLRNTYQVLLGHVSLGAMAADEDERLRRLQLIERALEESRPLLDQLMRLAHPDEGAIETLDVAAALRTFHAQAARVLPSTIQVGLDVPETLPPVLLNQSGLAHALWNLVINAKHAIEGDGRIDLRAGCDRFQVWIEVADTGSGIPKEVKERIFDPYFTTKPVGQGTGLGLTAVARFVRGSNGLVQVESTVGRGTTFRLRFPVAPAEHGAASAPTAQTA